jgi:hypothetical protein
LNVTRSLFPAASVRVPRDASTNPDGPQAAHKTVTATAVSLTTVTRSRPVGLGFGVAASDDRLVADGSERAGSSLVEVHAGSKAANARTATQDRMTMRRSMPWNGSPFSG